MKIFVFNAKEKTQERETRNVTFTEAFAVIIKIFLLGTFIGNCIKGFYNILHRGR